MNKGSLLNFCRRFAAFILIFSFSLAFLISCSDDNEFTYCELTLILDEDFETKESKDFDLFLSNGEAAVSVTRISFEAGFSQGISDTYTAKGFAAFFMNKSGKSEELLMYGEVPYYTYTEKGEKLDLFYTVTFYRSMNAYFVVAYTTAEENRSVWSERFLTFAKNAYFNDAPIIKT